MIVKFKDPLVFTAEQYTGDPENPGVTAKWLKILSLEYEGHPGDWFLKVGLSRVAPGSWFVCEEGKIIIYEEECYHARFVEVSS